MKRKQSLPTVINYDDLTDLFYGKIPVIRKFRDAGSSSFGIQVEKRRDELLNSLKKNKDVIDEIEDKMLEFIKFSIAHRPDVYVARTKNKENDKEYFTAKTFMPQKGGKKKEVKVYVGKAEDYDFNTKNPKAKIDAVRKMRKTLIRRLNEGTI